MPYSYPELVLLMWAPETARSPNGLDCRDLERGSLASTPQITLVVLVISQVTFWVHWPTNGPSKSL